MKKILILIIVVLASALFFHDELKQIISPPEVTVKYEDLILRDGLRYQKFSNDPFTGKTSGKKQGSFKNGKLEGAFFYYHKNGQLFRKGNYKNGKRDGEWVAYYRNGQLMSKGNYKNGNQEGEWVQYWSSGKLYFKGDYKKGTVLNDEDLEFMDSLSRY